MSAVIGMRRGKWLLLALAAVAGLIGSSGGAAIADAGDGTAAAERPDIVAIVTDDLGMLTMEKLLEAGLMPNLQQHVIDQGTTFTESFVTTSLCCPARATILTGRYSHNNMVLANTYPMKNGSGILWFDRYGDGELDGDYEGENETLPVWLDRAGYNTGYVGKYLNGHGKDRPQDHVPPGWDDWQGLVDPSTYCVYDYDLYDSKEDVVVRYAKDGTITRSRDGEVIDTRQAENWQDNYQTDVLSGRSVDFIREAGSEPLFLNINPLAPHFEACTMPDKEEQEIKGLWHLTIRPAERYADTSSLPALPEDEMPSLNEADMTDKPEWLWDPANRRYRPLLDAEDMDNLRAQFKDRIASMRSVDDMIGDVVEELKAQGRWDNTVLMFTSDNGWLSGQHRLSQKMFAYEPSIRVPLYVRMPGMTGPQTRDGKVLNNDLAPTIVDLAGAEIPADFPVDGKSYAPLLEEGGDPEWGRKRFLVSNYLIRDTVWTLPSFYAVRGPQSLYVRWKDAYDSREFYPALHTPGGAVQLQNRYPELGSGTRDQLDRMIYWFARCSGDFCRTLEGF